METPAFPPARRVPHKGYGTNGELLARLTMVCVRVSSVQGYGKCRILTHAACGRSLLAASHRRRRSLYFRRFSWGGNQTWQSKREAITARWRWTHLASLRIRNKLDEQRHGRPLKVGVLQNMSGHSHRQHPAMSVRIPSAFRTVRSDCPAFT